MVAKKAELRLKIQKLETLHDAIQNAVLDAGGVIPPETLPKLRLCLTELHGARWNTIWQLDKLTGDGSVCWNSNTNHWETARLVIGGEGAFSGSISMNR